jgi:hypothetical protein
MTNIIFPDQTETIDKIRNAIAREVDFFIPSFITCSACSLDPVNNSSTDSFCPVCSGSYFIPTYEEVPVTGYISWGFSEQLGWNRGGQIAEGDCRVQIKYTETNISLVENAEYLHVDHRKMKITKQTLRGTPTLNRILLDLQELDRKDT